MNRPDWNALPVETPAVLIDLDRAEANLRRGAAIAVEAGVSLRPHTKTHKSPYFARQQLALGARGLTVAKVSEAEVMADAGFDDLFIASTPYGADRAARIRRLAARLTLTVGVDHLEQARLLSGAMAGSALPLGIMVEVETGGRRGGVTPDAAGVLAAEIMRLPGLAITGVYTYEGYTYSAPDREALAAVARRGQEQLIAAGQAVGAVAGIEPVVSAGSTPGLFSGMPYLPGITEIRPGTYIFLDAAQAALAGGLEHCAAFVLATVVSRPRPDRAILDTGSKALTSDTRAAGLCRTEGHGVLPDYGLTIARLSEEHGVVEGPGAEVLQVGQRVRVIPNHICPVVNLFDEVVALRGGRVEAILPVAARGRLQ